MKKSLALIIGLSLCSAVFAEKLLDTPVKHAAPKFVSMGSGGIAGPTVYYDNTATPYGYVFSSGAAPRRAMDDIVLAGGAGAYTDTHTVGWVASLAEDFDMYVQFFDNISLTTADPVNSGFISGYFFEVRGVPAGAWYTILDVGSIGGVTFPDDNFGMEHLWFEPGSTTTLSNNGTAMFPVTGAGPVVGTSEDVYFRDADNNGRYNNPPDGRFFGGPPYLANFFAALAGSGGVCCPSDSNCDGSVNGFDIDGFIGCLAADTATKIREVENCHGSWCLYRVKSKKGDGCDNIRSGELICVKCPVDGDCPNTKTYKIVNAAGDTVLCNGEWELQETDCRSCPARAEKVRYEFVP